MEEEEEQHNKFTNHKIATHTQLQDDDEDDDGPPPGFQCILNRPPPQATAADDEEDDGPPPGFDSVAPKSSALGSPVNESNGFHDMEKGSKQDEFNDVNDDDEGPPPGWEFSALESALPVSSITTDRKRESNEELDEGPPPGWGTPLPHQTPLPRTPPLQLSSSVSSSIEIDGKVKIMSNDDEVPPSAPDGRPVPEHSSPVSPPSKVPSNIIGNKGNDKKVRIKRPTFGNQPASLPKPTAQPSSAEKAQLICGKCRKLCWYPRGAKWVQCPGCLDTNFVLEAQEIGQVKCGSCEVLLMYPHWAPAVQCTSCQFVNEIGEHNRRPPLSVQQEAKRRGSRSNRAR